MPKEVFGILLYEKKDKIIQPDNLYQMIGNKISLRTLDLKCDVFAEINHQLNANVEEHFGAEILALGMIIVPGY